jgi:REP element-mobilizing transposase RayT
MEHYRRSAHTRFDLKYHFVWITKYRKKLLQADVGDEDLHLGSDLEHHRASQKLRDSASTSATS